ncbi:MAG TPA: hypothetical protein VFA48_05240 [Gammaproteobacteria bacterium]|nr:hypothetical protein [Gammaproteobacteria bacterium]
MLNTILKRLTSLMLCAAAALPLPLLAQGFNGTGYGPGMMGGGYGPGMMMGGGVSNRPVSPGWGGQMWSYTKVERYLAESNRLGEAGASYKTVRFRGPEITINMVAVQPGHVDGTFEVHGITNPTLIVPLGAVVHLNLVNMDYGDNMEHGVIITPAGPPYAFMSMMQTGQGLAGVMPFLPWRSDEDVKTAHYAALGSTFMARAPGTYWYVCLTPGHAAKGMYGRFVAVSGS